MRRRLFAPLLLLALPALAATTLLDRLTEPTLRALRQDTRPLRQAAQPTPMSGEWQDVRTALHAHSELSHDSRMTGDQIAAAAKAAGVRAMFMSDHPTPDRRWFIEGLRGERNGVLFIPGAELSSGLTVWRDDGTRWTPGMSAKEVLEKLQEGAVSVIAHPEQRKTDADWDLPAFTGMEIYNTHADAADSNFEQLGTLFGGKNALKGLLLVQTLKKYPREAFAAVFDEQTAVLKRWDQLNVGFLASGRRVVGTAGNDSHQNVGVKIEAGENELLVKDGLGKVVSMIDKKSVPLLLFGNLEPGAVLLEHQFDPYAISLGYVSTHLLAKEVTEPALFDALTNGRAYVAFDWMADPSGFRCYAEADGKTIDMGSSIPVASAPKITVKPNMPAEIRLLRNGEVIKTEENAAELTFEAKEPGVYRAEVWVKLAQSAESRPWIYSNPIYIPR